MEDPIFCQGVHHSPFDGIQPQHPVRTQRLRSHIDGAFLVCRFGSRFAEPPHEGATRIVVRRNVHLPGGAVRHPALGLNVRIGPHPFQEQTARVQ